jgi:hypothetical protein
MFTSFTYGIDASTLNNSLNSTDPPPPAPPPPPPGLPLPIDDYLLPLLLAGVALGSFYLIRFNKEKEELKSSNR